jgi:hypothetical protein
MMFAFLRGRKSTRKNRPNRASAWKPHLEVLEDRTVPSGLTQVSQNFFGGSGNEVASSIAVVDTGSDYSVYAAGRLSGTTNKGLLIQYRVPYALGGVSQAGSTTWPGGGGDGYFTGVAATSAAVYAAGASYSQTTDIVGDKEEKGIIVSFPSDGGNSTWAKQTPPPPGAFSYGGFEHLNAVTVAVEGGQTFLYATGISQSGFFNDGRVYVSKVDANGNVLWTRTDPTGTPTSNGLAIAADAGNVYVAGFSDDSGTRTAYLKKYDQNGGLLWARTSSPGLFNGLIADAATGSIYAVGQTNGPNADFLIEKWDSASGTVLWSQTYDRGGATDILQGVTLLDGRLYAAGSTTGDTAGGSDGVVLEIDAATGALLDTTLWGGSADDGFQGIAATPGGLHVVGTTTGFGSGGSDIAYVLYSVVTEKATPVFSQLSSPTVIVGTDSTTLSGKISLDNLVPTGNVTITLNAVSKSVAINPDGSFSASFDTGSLAVGAYPISYSYGGDEQFNAATGEGTLTITYSVGAAFNQSHAHQAGSTIPFRIQLSDADGQAVSTPTTVSVLGIASVLSPDTVLPAEAPGKSNPGNHFNSSGGGLYQYNLKTSKSLAPGSYVLYFMIEGDPVVHSLEFEVK